MGADPNYVNSSQCTFGGTNEWEPNHGVWDDGKWDRWVLSNTPYSWGHYKRSDIPAHFSIADAFTVGDMYMQSVMGGTTPNRVTWASGTVNVPGGNTSPDQGGVYIENWATPGCQSPGLNCYPLNWKTTPEYLEEAGISWYVYQSVDNFGDNPFLVFEQYQNAAEDDPLAVNALSFLGMQKFFDDCASGNLPEVSYVVGPMELSEHPPWMPKDGGWLQQQVVNAVVNSPKYENTALIISFDESGGWGDHVLPYISPNGTAGEWLWDPENITHFVPSGPGARVPFVIVSPWTSGKSVFVEPADHNSQILFLEQWALANGKNITSSEMVPWRRQWMSNLVNAFDFANPNYTRFNITGAETPITNFAGNYLGTIDCLAEYGGAHSPIPYGNQTSETALAVEPGYREMRGRPTEGRYNVFIDISTGLALALSNDNLTLVTAHPTPGYMNKTQGFFIGESQALWINEFSIRSALNPNFYVANPTQPNLATPAQLNADSDADVLFTGAYTVPILTSQFQGGYFVMTYNSAVGGYSIQAQSYYAVPGSKRSPYMVVAKNGAVTWSMTPSYFKMYAVTY